MEMELADFSVESSAPRSSYPSQKTPRRGYVISVTAAAADRIIFIISLALSLTPLPLRKFPLPPRPKFETLTRVGKEFGWLSESVLSKLLRLYQELIYMKRISFLAL